MLQSNTLVGFRFTLDSKSDLKPTSYYFGAVMRKLVVVNENLHRSGIYEIVNDQGFHKYVGQSVDITSRWKKHVNDLRSNKHTNTHLQNAFNKYGERHFSFAVLEFCKPRDLMQKEQYWIDKLKPEYNIVKDVLNWSMNFDTDEKRHNSEYYQDADYSFRRPIWHKWVYGGHKKR